MPKQKLRQSSGVSAFYIPIFMRVFVMCYEFMLCYSLIHALRVCAGGALLCAFFVRRVKVWHPNIYVSRLDVIIA